MHDIHCPHCGKAFKIDESGYADILKQVRDSDFEHQLHERLELAERDKQNAVALTKANVASEMQKAAAAKDSEIQELKAKLNAETVERKLAVNEAVNSVQKERDELANALTQAKREQQTATELAQAKLNAELQRAAAAKDAEIQELKAKLETIALTQQIAIKDAVGSIAKERDDLKSAVDRSELEKQLAEQSLNDKY